MVSIKGFLNSALAGVFLFFIFARPCFADYRCDSRLRKLKTTVAERFERLVRGREIDQSTTLEVIDDGSKMELIIQPVRDPKSGQLKQSISLRCAFGHWIPSLIRNYEFEIEVTGYRSVCSRYSLVVNESGHAFIELGNGHTMRIRKIRQYDELTPERRRQPFPIAQVAAAAVAGFASMLSIHSIFRSH